MSLSNHNSSNLNSSISNFSTQKLSDIDFSKTTIGIELGSTRIKAVMIDNNFKTIASGDFQWENRLEDGFWTYHYDEIIGGLQTCYKNLKADVKAKTGKALTTTGSIGISAMMHGYIPSDAEWKPLCNFRTWRNTTTAQAAEKLTMAFSFNIPQRWCISHLFQAIINKEDHVKDIAHVQTLAAYVHHLLTGQNVIGIDDASGMFPIDYGTKNYNLRMATIFKDITSHLPTSTNATPNSSIQPTSTSKYSSPLTTSQPVFGLDIFTIFPKVLTAGQYAGSLTTTGALLLDPEGDLLPGIPMAPPEGDAGTGMVATNSVRLNTGNVSAGTSDFAMVVTDKKLSVHREIDMVTTPTGTPVAMVHCNNCTTDINNWVNLFAEFATRVGLDIPRNRLYSLLYGLALEGTPCAGGLLSCNYYSGEGVTNFNQGIPLFLHKPEASVNLPNFMRCHLMSAMATLKIGMDILHNEGVTIDKIYGHGGFFKSTDAGKTILSAAINAPVSVMQTASEGGPYGMALLSAYMLWGNGQRLEDFLDNHVFANVETSTVMADKKQVKGFNEYIKSYHKVLDLERFALEAFNA